MKWILIFISVYGATSSGFKTKIACNTAGVEMEERVKGLMSGNPFLAGPVAQAAWGCFPEGRTGRPRDSEKNL